MGTKTNPGRFDAYAKAHDDEPIFTLLGRDPDAPSIIRLWADMRERRGESKDVVVEALELADEFEAYGENHPKERWHIVDTDNFGGDYPNEKFFARDLPNEILANEVCEFMNRGVGDISPRICKVVKDGYQLRPGFSP